MDASISGTSIDLLNRYLWYFGIGLGVFIVGMIGMVVAFGWSTKDVLKNSKTVVIMLVFSFLTPFLAGQMFYSNPVTTSARQEVQILNVQVDRLNNGKTQVVVQFATPVVGYLEYKDLATGKITPVFATSGQKEIKKNFIINNIGSLGGEATVVVNGVNYFFRNGPIKILSMK